ncbi:MAG: hypothetical protein ACKODJ_04720, partial [Bacteroidota bacterium]
MKNNFTMMGVSVTPWLTNRLSGYVVGLLCVLALFASAPQTNAQVSGYSFGSSTQSYTPITGGTNLTGFTSSTTYLDFGAISA